jgi:hypothetical protein
MATLFPRIAKFLSKSSEFSARVFTVVLCMITTDTQGISAMTTSLERTLAADLAECLKLDTACPFQIADAGDAINAPFFDIEDDYHVKADL